MSTFLEVRRSVGNCSECCAPVPFGPGLLGAGVVLPRGLRSKGEGGEVAVAGGLLFGVSAEETDQSYTR